MWIRCMLGVVIAMHFHGLAMAGKGVDGISAVSLAPGSVRVSTTLEVSMSTRALGKPMSVAPDLYVGVAPDWTVGLVHSGRALGLLDSGWGMCFTGADGGCDPVYAGTGVDAWFVFLRARGLELAVRSRLYAARFVDPLKLRVTLGVLGAYRLGWLGLRFDPHVSLGLVNRERGNADALNVPVEVLFALGCHADLYVRTGVRGLLRGFDEQYAVPVGLGVRVRPSMHWQVGVQYALRQILGPLNTYKPRDLIVFVDYQFDDAF